VKKVPDTISTNLMDFRLLLGFGFVTLISLAVVLIEIFSVPISQNATAISTPASDGVSTTETIETKELVQSTTTDQKIAQEPKDEVKEKVVKVEVAVSKSDLSLAAIKTRAAVVNVVCASTLPITTEMSGSGVIIDPRGIIVTNAHVAFYFLYMGDRDFDTNCIVRTGNPAKPAYIAKLMFISPQWVARNGISVLRQMYTGVNGDYDYAFLFITGSLTDDPLSEAFPYIPLNDSETFVKEPVVIVGYASEFLEWEQVADSLYQTVVNGSIKSGETFFGSGIDIVELGGNAAAQHGSSGGAIVNAAGKLEAIIAVGTGEENTAERKFQGLTAQYLRRAYAKEESKSLDTLFKDPEASVRAFSVRFIELQNISAY